MRCFVDGRIVRVVSWGKDFLGIGNSMRRSEEVRIGLRWFLVVGCGRRVGCG